MTTSTHTSTHNTSTPANPYLHCLTCGARIRRFTHVGDGQGRLGFEPCGHRGEYEDLCPSWGPVDGCTCGEPHRQSAGAATEETPR